MPSFDMGLVQRGARNRRTPYYEATQRYSPKAFTVYNHMYFPIRFDTFEVDLRSRELSKAGVRVQLQEQPFQILAMLLQRSGDIVTRDEIRDRLWPDGTFVDFEHSVNAAIKRLRAALGDTAENPRFVETLHRRGYRFIMPIESPGARPPASAVLTPLKKNDSRPRLVVLPFSNLSGET